MMIILRMIDDEHLVVIFMVPVSGGCGHGGFVDRMDSRTKTTDL